MAQAKAQKARKPEQAGEATAGGKQGKPWLLIGGIVLVAVGASVGGTVLLLGGGATAPEAAHAIPAAADALPEKALYKSLRPPFQVNFMVAQKPRVLQAELTLMSRDQVALDGVVAHEPLVRARLLDLLGAQDFLTLGTEEGRGQFREAARGVLDKLLLENGVEAKVDDVLLTAWVMQ
jgi:flagellar FliL protein